MEQHAYCIIAHTDNHCLQTLVNLVDDERNDIFILLDKKGDSSILKDIHSEKSNLYILPRNIDIRWGDISQVKAELALFEKVISTGKSYKFIHLLSGQDLPLHTQDYIHNFCKSLKEGTNLIGFSKGESNIKDLEYKTKYRHILTRYYKHPNRYIRFICAVIRKLFIFTQKTSRLSRSLSTDLSFFYKGCNWVSISQQFAQYLVENKKYILYRFRFVKCADEIYKQSLILSSPFKDTVNIEDSEFHGAMRKIDWRRGDPYIWKNEDFNELITSEELFARKFSSDVDINIINQLQNYLLSPNCNI